MIEWKTTSRFGKEMKQLSLFPEAPDKRTPVSVTWNLWHGCTRVSTGCQNCYMYRRDEAVGRDPSVVEKTKSFIFPMTTTFMMSSLFAIVLTAFMTSVLSVMISSIKTLE